MPLYKNLVNESHSVSEVEKHFHDHDETWIVVRGSATGFSIDHAGNREEFLLEAGDVWLIPAGHEHGIVGSTAKDLAITFHPGTIPEGSHEPSHYHMEVEGYIPSLHLIKTATDRYRVASEQG
jgi:uncharacterized protein YjlB